MSLITMTMEIEKEIRELLSFLASYHNASIPDDVNRLETCFSDNMYLISVSGRKIAKHELIKGIKLSYGSTKEASYWAENTTIEELGEGYYLAIFTEHRKTKGTTNSRISTSIFVPNQNAPNGVQWLHIHDTLVREVLY